MRLLHAARAAWCKERTLSVNIPAGVEDGTRIRLAGEGEAGLRGGPAGDLYIFLSIKPHEFFQRDGADIFCRVPISMTTAALGGHIDVPTVDGGKTRVKVPEGTETGKQFRLKGKGMPVLRSKVTGDMYIQVEVETPKNLDAPPARAARRVRAREQRGDLAALGRLLRQGEGVLRRQAELSRHADVVIAKLVDIAQTTGDLRNRCTGSWAWPARLTDHSPQCHRQRTGLWC